MTMDDSFRETELEKIWKIRNKVDEISCDFRVCFDSSYHACSQDTHGNSLLSALARF